MKQIKADRQNVLDEKIATQPHVRKFYPMLDAQSVKGSIFQN